MTPDWKSEDVSEADVAREEDQSVGAGMLEDLVIWPTAKPDIAYVLGPETRLAEAAPQRARQILIEKEP